MMKVEIIFFRLIIIFILFTSAGLLSAQTTTTLYSFFIAGHTFGRPGVNNIGLHPPFLNKFEYITGRPEIEFGVLLGDIVSPDPDAQDWDEVDVDIDSLGLPVYFAVGNHDMENRPLFESRYGITYYYFIFNNDLFIVLDPNIDGWNISGSQLEFLENTIDSNYTNVQNIFVFFHQLLWWEDGNIYKPIKPNSFFGRADSINFWSTIEPLFRQLPNQVVMFAGDVGAVSWSSNFMYSTYENITFIASGMGEEDGDNFIVVNVDSSKEINYDLICLDTPELNCFGNLIDYNVMHINNQTLSYMKLYPNPATDAVTLEFEDNTEYLVQLINILGKTVVEKKCKNVSSLTIDVTYLPRGWYVMKLTNNMTQISVSKFLIQ